MAYPGPPLKSLTPELFTLLKQGSEDVLFDIISANSKSKVCQTVDELSRFRDAVQTMPNQDRQHFLQIFRDLVPLTVYDVYKPFVSRFFNTPCLESDIVDLFAPGLPSVIFISSSTSGKAPKLVPKYNLGSWKYTDNPTVLLVSLKYEKVLDVVREDQSIVKKITVSTSSAAVARATNGWNVDQDQDRMSSKAPGAIAPYAVGMVIHHPSFLLLHALFALADPTVQTFWTIFCTTLADMFLYINRDWSNLLDAIDKGTIPNLEHIEHVRHHLEPHLHPNPARAAELRAIGPPSNTSGWAKCIWPNVNLVKGIGSGTFSVAVPKLKHLFGPDVVFQTLGFASSEYHGADAYQPGDLERLRIKLHDAYTEYLDVTAEEEASKLCAAWELEQGKHYEPIATTYNGFWRYHVGDVFESLGFAPDDGSPVVRYIGRRQGGLKLAGVLITEAQLYRSVCSATPGTIGQVSEFTCFEDTRCLPSTIGFFVELAQAPGDFSSTLAKQRLLDVLSSENEKFKRCHDIGVLGMPTIRVVKSGTFAAYRQQRGEASGSSTNQVKVPAVLTNAAVQEWIVDRVDFEV